MSVWFLLPMAISAGTSYAGQKAQNEATLAGAETSANIDAMNREFQKKVFYENMAMQKPFYEAGKSAIPLYDRAINNDLNPMESGMANIQERLLTDNTKGFSGYVKDLALGRLKAEEGEKQKGRLMDLMKIGLGASGSAGSSAVNLGGALANSYMSSGNTLANATMGNALNTQSMWNRTIDSLAGLPAYMASRKNNDDGFDPFFGGTI